MHVVSKGEEREEVKEVLVTPPEQSMVQSRECGSRRSPGVTREAQEVGGFGRQSRERAEVWQMGRLEIAHVPKN
jgi:hypothetical protein